MMTKKLTPREAAQNFINEGGQAEIIRRAEGWGVQFLDDGQFILFANLGYNSEYGFYDRQKFPDLDNDLAEYDGRRGRPSSEQPRQTISLSLPEDTLRQLDEYIARQKAAGEKSNRTRVIVQALQSLLQEAGAIDVASRKAQEE